MRPFLARSVTSIRRSSIAGAGVLSATGPVSSMEHRVGSSSTKSQLVPLEGDAHRPSVHQHQRPNRPGSWEMQTWAGRLSSAASRSPRMRTWRLAIRLFALSTIVALGAIPTAAERANFDVDLKLILAVDVSDSMSWQELQLQRQGYATTFRDPRIARAIASGEIGRIAVLYLEWGGPDHLHVVGPWTVLATQKDTAAFADMLASEPAATVSSMSNRAMSFGKALDQAPIATATATSISASLLFARESFTTGAFVAIVR